MANLPEGFVLDEPKKQMQELPEGFVVDSTDQAMQEQIQQPTQDLEGKILPEGQTPPEGYEYYHDPMRGNVLTKKAPERTIGEKAKGAEEAFVATASGMAGGLAGSVLGGLKGLYDEISSGDYFTTDINKRREQQAKTKKLIEDIASSITIPPETEVGKEYTQNVAETLAPLEALTPMTAELGAVSRVITPKVAETVQKVIPPKAPKPLTAVETAMVEAQKRNIPVMTTDINPPKTFFGKSIQSTGEKIPVAGTAGMREAQQKARISAIEDTVATFGSEDSTLLTDRIMESLSRKRSDTIGRYSDIKKEVIGRLSKNDNKVIPENTIKAIDEEASRLRSIGTEASNKAANEIEKFKPAFENKTLSGIEDVRSDLGELFKNPDLISSKTQGQKSINKIYGAINQDMGDFINTYGEKKDFSKWKIANKELSKNMSELESSTLKNVLKKGNIKPEEVNRLLFSKAPSELKLLYKNLDKEGRNNAKMALFGEAIDRSTLDKAGGVKEISPARFKSELNRLSNNMGVFLSKSEKEDIDGLAKALSITDQADKFALNPPTGVQLSIPMGMMVASDMFGTGGAATIGTGTLGLAIKMYEKIPVKNALKRLSKAKKGTPEYNSAAEKLMTAILAEKQSQEQNETK